jgi:hypothetical protein
MTVPIGAAALMMATVVPVASASSSDVPPPPDKTALIMGGSTVPTPNAYWVEATKNQFIEPLYPDDQNINYVVVTTPEEIWPIGGIFRIVGLTLLVVDPQHTTPELIDNQFNEVPWWKFSGLTDRLADQSVDDGVTDLEAEMAKHPGEPLIINGYSQSAAVAIAEKERLAEQYPEGTEAPDIDFVLGGDPRVPNGGLWARFPGLPSVILGTFAGPEPTDTQFDTTVIIRQYDAMADFPLYPLNVVAGANAVLGFFFVHAYGFDVSLAPDPEKSGAIHTTTGDTDYYFFPTDDLPLFTPLRLAGVPEPVIDVVEPVTQWAVELGYDRSIPPGEPTPARLIPPINSASVTSATNGLVEAVHESVDNAVALIDPPDTSTMTTFGGADANDGSVVGSPGKVVDLNAFGDRIDNSLGALNPFSTDQGNKQAGTDVQNSGPQTALGRWRKLTPKSLTDGFKFTPVKPGSGNADNQTGGPLGKVGADVSDSLQRVGKNVDKTIKKATDSVTKGFSGFKGHKVGSKADDIRSRVR